MSIIEALSWKARLACSTALVLASATSAMAQPANTAPADQSPTTATNTSAIIVTGSRVSRKGYTAPTPTTVISSEAIQNQAPVTISDVLFELPSVRPSPNSTSTSQASGNYVNLRGLGATRTLTLVDGRRFVPSNGAENSGGSSVDVNLIPEALVDRIDIVTGGASAAWGSDAIGGVVNIVLKHSIQGIQGKFQYGTSGEGDAKSVSASLAGGTSFDHGRGQAMLAVEYSRSWDMPTLADRAYSSGHCAFAPGVVNGVAYRGVKTCGLTLNSYTNGGVIVSSSGGPLSPIDPLYGRQFLSPTASSPFDYGQIVTSSFSIGGQGGWKSDDSVIIAPLTRKIAYGRLLYDFTPNLSGFVEASYGDSGTKVNLFPNSVPASTDFPIQIQAGNPYIPADVQAIMAANNISSFYLDRIAPELGPDKSDSDNQVGRVAAGLNGSFGKTWSWNGYFTYGHDWYDTEYGNNIIVSNFAAATDVIINPATGAPDCRINVQGPAAPGTAAYGAAPGCVPANPFGPGSLASAKNYVEGTLSQKSNYGQLAGGAVLRGDAFDDWAGAVSVALGVDYRHEWVTQHVSPYADFLNPPIFASGGFQQSNPKSFSGGYKVAEAFGEVVVPLLADQRFAKSLDLNGAARLTHYSTSGTVTTWKFGATYEPIEGILFRAAHSKDIRAASLFENFGSNTTYATVTTRGAGGVATGTANVVSPGRSNPNLKPEQAKTTTFGFTLRNVPISRMYLSVDAYNIDLKDTIGKLGAQGIIDRCYGGGTAAGQTPDQASCSFISNNETVVVDPFLNLGTMKTKGIEFDAAYVLPAHLLIRGAQGEFSARVLANYVAKLEQSSTGLNPVDLAGDESGLPHWRWTANLSYDSDHWGAMLQGRYIGAMSRYKYAAPNTYVDPTVPAYFYLDATAKYNVPAGGRRHVELFVNVKNILDKDPPFVPSTGANAYIAVPGKFAPFLRYTQVQFYDVLGRTFNIGARFAF